MSRLKVPSVRGIARERVWYPIMVTSVRSGGDVSGETNAREALIRSWVVATYQGRVNP
jgi:hypothetical protein